MNKFRNTAIAGLAAVAFVAAGAVANPGQAQAGDLGKVIVGGLILGAVATAVANHHAHAVPVYGASCYLKTQITGYNVYGQPIYQQVQYCY